MVRLNNNAFAEKKFTHEGGAASLHVTPLQELRRAVMSCLLWENGFYENGEDIAARIVNCAHKVTPVELAQVAVEARKVYNLRHVPLLLASILCKVGSGNALVSETLAKVIDRADELTEFVSVYAKLNGVSNKAIKKKLSAQAKKGLAMAFEKFDEYHFAKYNRDTEVKLRDVLFLCHAKAKNDERDALYKRIVANTLTNPDTWEVALSAGGDKKETFERLLNEGKLGYFALIRNLRNMIDAGVNPQFIKPFVTEGKGRERILPFRYIAAARACPKMEPYLDEAMLASIKALPKLIGKTIVLVDVSSSMDTPLSSKSDMTREDAACGLAAVINGENVETISFSGTGKQIKIPPRSGMAMVDAIKASQGCTGTDITSAVNFANAQGYDRLIVITDEQSNAHQTPDPIKGSMAYMINVAMHKNGISYGTDWKHLDGFSENVLRFIYEFEQACE